MRIRIICHRPRFALTEAGGNHSQMLLLYQRHLSRIAGTTAKTVTFESLIQVYLLCLELGHRFTTRGSYAYPLHLPDLGKAIQLYLKRARFSQTAILGVVDFISGDSVKSPQ